MGSRFEERAAALRDHACTKPASPSDQRAATRRSDHGSTSISSPVIPNRLNEFLSNVPEVPISTIGISPAWKTKSVASLKLKVKPRYAPANGVKGRTKTLVLKLFRSSATNAALLVLKNAPCT